MSVASEAGTRAVRSLESLLTVAEGIVSSELLFSFVLPTDVVKKYEFMREQAMQRAGLYNSPSRIWQLQREAQAKQQASSGRTSREYPEVVKPDPESIGAKYELVARLDAAHELLRHYQKMLSGLSRTFDDLLALSESDTGIRKAVSQLTDLVRRSPDKPLRVSEFESSQAKLARRYKDLENEAQLAFARFLEELGLKQSNLEATLTRVITNTRRMKERIRTLEVKDHEADTGEASEVALLRSRLQSEKQAYEDKIQSLKAQHRQRQDYKLEDSRKSMRREMEELTRSRDNAIDEAHRLQIELEQQRVQADAEITQLQETYRREIELLSSSLGDYSESKTHDHQVQLDDLRKGSRLRESELLGKIEQIKAEGLAELDALREQYTAAQIREEDLHQLLRAIGERLHSIYLKYSTTHKDFTYNLPKRSREFPDHDESWRIEGLMEADFVVYLVGKMGADNDWLVERLAEFGKENDRLKRKATGSPLSKSEGLNSQVREAIESTSDALKDFESARDRLVKQFRVSSSESTRRSESPDIVTALYKKYMATPDR